MLGDDCKAVSLRELCPLEDATGKQRQDTSASAEKSKPVANTTARSKDATKETVYKPDVWKGHLRGYTMGRYIKRQQSARDQQSVRKSEEDADLEYAQLMEPPVGDRMEGTVVGMHYFPHEKCKARLIPCFQDSHDCECIQLCKWTKDFFIANPNRSRKICFVLVCFALTVVSVHFIRDTPHE